MLELVREIEARKVLADHLATLALGGDHPNAVVVPREPLEIILAHRCGVVTPGEWVAVLPDGEVMGMFPSLKDADEWAALRPDADEIVKTKVVSPTEWREPISQEQAS